MTCSKVLALTVSSWVDLGKVIPMAWMALAIQLLSHV